MLSRLAPYMVFILLGAFILGSQVFFIVSEPEQAIVLQFGEPVRTITEPGLSMKMPFIQNVLKFDKRVLSSDATPQEYLTSDKKRLVVDHVTRWQIVDPLAFYKAVRTERAARGRLDEFVFSGLREELALVPFQNVVSDQREPIMDKVTETSAVKARALGIDVVDVRVKRADLPEDVEESVFLRMRAERERESSLFRAEGEEQANIIRSRAERDATVISAEGYQEAQTLRGEGEAEAIRIYAEALEQDPEFYAFSRRLEAYSSILKQGDNLVIPADSEFFRYLTNPETPAGVQAEAAEQAAPESESEAEAAVDATAESEPEPAQDAETEPEAAADNEGEPVAEASADAESEDSGD